MTHAGPSGPLQVHIDLSDTARAEWRAGIQRVVLQLLVELEGADERIEIVPVLWLGSAECFRRMTPDEREALDASDGVARPGGSTASPLRRLQASSWVRTSRRLLRPLRRAARALIECTGARPMLRSGRRFIELRTRDRRLRPLVHQLEPGSVLLELDSVWNIVEVDREDLYRRLRRSGVHIAALVYDLLPVEHPEWFEQSLVEVFERALRAELAHAELVLSISEHTSRSLVEWASSLGLAPPEPIVITLGADVERVRASVPAAVPAELRSSRYVLTVGTVEPRKNHRVLLDAFEQLWLEHPDVHLVVVGRAGWHNESLIERLRTHERFASSLHWFDSAGDELLSTLYRDATIVAVPSITEGFGLPVIEAMSAGVPVVSSRGGALPEAGGSSVDFVDPDDLAGWVTTLGELLSDEASLELRRRRLEDYEPPRWSTTAEQVAEALWATFGASGSMTNS